jgi:hypothetical protein
MSAKGENQQKKNKKIVIVGKMKRFAQGVL